MKGSSASSNTHQNSLQLAICPRPEWSSLQHSDSSSYFSEGTRERKKTERRAVLQHQIRGLMLTSLLLSHATCNKNYSCRQNTY